LASNERALSIQRVAAASRLRDDVVRRVNAGDLSRADRHQAEGVLATAQAQQAEAESASVLARSRLQALVGQIPAESDVIPEPVANLLPVNQSADDHPGLRALQARGDVSRRSLELARARTRNSPEIAVGTRRERSVSGEAMDQTWALALRIPFSSGARNDARISEANADLIESTLQYDRERERLSHERSAAEVRLSSARSQLSAAELRARLAIENRGFFEKSFRLGETDLPTRLRIELEAFEAERQASRAQINLAQSISTYRQVLGLLPE
jgi:cobalt-zinc-cadmium efflux system outer membrane protein